MGKQRHIYEPCGAETLLGRPCRARPHPADNDGRCRAHSKNPILIEEVRKGSRKGGQNSQRVSMGKAMRVIEAMPGPHGDLLMKLANGIDAVEEGTMDPRALTAISQAARAIVGVFDQAVVLAKLERWEQARRLERSRPVGPTQPRAPEEHGWRVYDADGEEIPLLDTGSEAGGGEEDGAAAPSPEPDRQPRSDDPPWVQERNAKRPRGRR